MHPSMKLSRLETPEIELPSLVAREKEMRSKTKALRRVKNIRDGIVYTLMILTKERNFLLLKYLGSTSLVNASMSCTTND